MQYTDRLLSALGAWQQGWREEKDRRIPITIELRAAIDDMLPAKLPVSARLPTCFRKRFLVPNNPQNGGDFWKLIIEGSIPEGTASWTTSDGFARIFKNLHRDGCLTAIFEHRPKPSEVVVDVTALWKDETFKKAAESYIERKSAFSAALENFRDLQSEIILDAPLRCNEAIDFIGVIESEDYFFQIFGAETEEAQDVIWKSFADLGAFPGDRKWTGRVGAQRAVTRLVNKYKSKYLNYAYSRLYREFLVETTNKIKFKEFLHQTGLIEIFK